MDVGAIVSLATVALNVLLAQTRIFYAMSLDGLLPPFFARVHNHTKTPWISTVISGMYCVTAQLIGYSLSFFTGVLCAVMAGFGPVDIVSQSASISTLTTYIITHVIVVVVSSVSEFRLMMYFEHLLQMRYTHREGIQRPFSVPFGS
jgi:APA family basic amino acid/polyamine antiporter